MRRWNAKRVAQTRLRAQCGLNRRSPDGPESECWFEFAYSPSTGAVALRHVDGNHEPFSRYDVFNISYPRYGLDTQITDWISVGVETPAPQSMPSPRRPRARSGIG